MIVDPGICVHCVSSCSCQTRPQNQGPGQMLLCASSLRSSPANQTPRPSQHRANAACSGHAEHTIDSGDAGLSRVRCSNLHRSDSDSAGSGDAILRTRLPHLAVKPVCDHHTTTTAHHLLSPLAPALQLRCYPSQAQPSAVIWAPLVPMTLLQDRFSPFD